MIDFVDRSEDNENLRGQPFFSEKIIACSGTGLPTGFFNHDQIIFWKKKPNKFVK